MKRFLGLVCAVCLVGGVFFSCVSTPDPVLPLAGGEEDDAGLPVSDGQEPADGGEAEAEEGASVSEEPVHPVWRQPETIDGLSGSWLAEDGTGYAYPFTADGRRYLRYHGAWQDVTAAWQKMADDEGISVAQLWQKRYAVRYVLGENTLPCTDGNGTQAGIKFRQVSGRILIRTDLLVPELVFARNLSYFKLSPDGTRFREEGVFHLFSDLFSDIPQGKQTYQKVRDGGKNEAAQ